MLHNNTSANRVLGSQDCNCPTMVVVEGLSVGTCLCSGVGMHMCNIDQCLDDANMLTCIPQTSKTANMTCPPVKTVLNLHGHHLVCHIIHPDKEAMQLLEHV